MVRVGIAGMGFMGKTHLAAYQAASAAGFPCELVAICDPDPSRLIGPASTGGNLAAAESARQFDLARLKAFSSCEDLLVSDIDLLSICTYTDTHVDLALAALAAGKHVLIEKPIAVKSADVERLAKAARNARTHCMPAMCIRFWPGWDFLREAVRDGRYGPVRSATFTRLGSGPNWANAFYADHSRSGGAAVDLHIHDVDFILWCFGIPTAVSSTGDALHITTQYHYENGPAHIVAEAAWDLAPTAGFRMKFLVNFEKATLEFDLSKTPALTVFTPDGPSPIDLPAITGYDGEVRHIVRAIAAGQHAISPTIDQAVAVSRTIESELQSIASRAWCEIG